MREMFGYMKNSMIHGLITAGLVLATLAIIVVVTKVALGGVSTSLDSMMGGMTDVITAAMQ